MVYASGDSPAIIRCAGLFADFAKQSADLGAYGNGSRMKFIANHLVAIHNVATAEAMLLAQRAGLDPKMVVDMVGPGAGGSRMFQMRAPMMVEGVYDPATMKVSMWEKDMAIIAEFAADVGCATPLFTLTQPVYAQAMAMGLGDQDTASVFEVLKETIVTDPRSAAGTREDCSPDGASGRRVSAEPLAQSGNGCGDDPGFRKGSIRATGLYQRHCERSEAIQLSSCCRQSWIASSQALLAMTLWEFDSNFKQQHMRRHSRNAMRPRFASMPPSKKKEGAGKAGCALHPRSRVQKLHRRMRTRAYRAAEAIRLSLRGALRLITRSSR